MKRRYKDAEIVDGVKGQNHEVISFLYSEVKPKVENYILNNKGCKADVDDVFQSGIIKLFLMVRRGKCPETSVLGYLYSICIHEWRSDQGSSLSEIGKQQEYAYYKVVEMLSDKEDGDENYQKELMKVFGTLGEDCRKVFIMRANNYSYEQIAGEMGYASSNFVRVKRSRCYEQLVKRLRLNKEKKK